MSQNTYVDAATGERFVLGYRLGPTLGKGAQGKVKLATRPADGAQVALKIICLDGISAVERAHLAEETMALVLCASGHTTELLQAEGRVLYPRKRGGARLCAVLVLEYCAGGELLRYLEHGGAFEEDLARTFFRQLLVAIATCHDKGVAHRDIKPENLLLDGMGSIKLTDFGLSCHSTASAEEKAAPPTGGGAATAAAAASFSVAGGGGDEDDDSPRQRRRLMGDEKDAVVLAAAAGRRAAVACSTTCGTVSYSAPEVLNSALRTEAAALGATGGAGGGARGRCYDGTAADVWSAGVVLFTMLAGHPPFQRAAGSDWWFRACLAGRHDRFWAAHLRGAPPGRFPPGVMELLSAVFQCDPTRRASAADLLDHPWVAEGKVLTPAEVAAALAPKAAAADLAEALADPRAAAEPGVFDGLVRSALGR